MNSEFQNERISYLVDKVYNDGKIVFIDDDIMPDTFARDMQCIFGCNPETDILQGLLRGDEHHSDCTVVVIEKDMSRTDILVALSDYVNGVKIPFILCAFPGETAVKTQYELDLGSEYVEGPAELFVGDVPVLDYDNLLLWGPPSLGLEAGKEPSDAAKAIAEGKHFVKELYDANGEQLV